MESLCDISQRLTRLGAEGGAVGNIQGRGPVDDVSQGVLPWGPWPEPKVKCFVFEYTEQYTLRKLVVSEYVNSDHLIFNFETVVFDQGNETVTRCDFVFDKNNLSGDFLFMVRVAKDMTRNSTVIFADKGGMILSVGYIVAKQFLNWTYWSDLADVRVKLKPPTAVVSCAYALTQAPEIGECIDTFRFFRQQLDGRRVRVITEITVVPPAGPPAVDGP